jgi:transportin-3
MHPHLPLVKLDSVAGGSGSEEALLIVHALAEVTSHPDDNIAAITFNFWHRLSLALTTRYSNS